MDQRGELEPDAVQPHRCLMARFQLMKVSKNPQQKALQKLVNQR